MKCHILYSHVMQTYYIHDRNTSNFVIGDYCPIAANLSARIHIIRRFARTKLLNGRFAMDAFLWTLFRNTIWYKEKSKLAWTHSFFVQFTWDLHLFVAKSISEVKFSDFWEWPQFWSGTEFVNSTYASCNCTSQQKRVYLPTRSTWKNDLLFQGKL